MNESNNTFHRKGFEMGQVGMAEVPKISEYSSSTSPFEWSETSARLTAKGLTECETTINFIFTVVPVRLSCAMESESHVIGFAGVDFEEVLQ